MLPSYKERIIGQLVFPRRNNEDRLPNDVLFLIICDEGVPLTTQRLLHKRLAKVYLYIFKCRRHQHMGLLTPPYDLTRPYKDLIEGLVKTYLAMSARLVTDKTVVSLSHWERSRDVQVLNRRKAWRAQNPVFNGTKPARWCGVDNQIYAFLVQTIEMLTEPNDEEFYQEYQLEIAVRDEKTPHYRKGGPRDLASSRLCEIRCERFMKLERFLYSLTYELPLALNKIFGTKENNKLACESFLSGILGRIVRHYIHERRTKWPLRPNIVFPVSFATTPLKDQLTNARHMQDTLLQNYIRNCIDDQ